LCDNRRSRAGQSLGNAVALSRARAEGRLCRRRVSPSLRVATCSDRGARHAEGRIRSRSEVRGAATWAQGRMLDDDLIDRDLMLGFVDCAQLVGGRLRRFPACHFRATLSGLQRWATVVNGVPEVPSSRPNADRSRSRHHLGHLAKVRVAGSNPVVRSNQKPWSDPHSGIRRHVGSPPLVESA
jgi:hypothetical protein